PGHLPAGLRRPAGARQRLGPRGPGALPRRRPRRRLPRRLRRDRDARRPPARRRAAPGRMAGRVRHRHPRAVRRPRPRPVRRGRRRRDPARRDPRRARPGPRRLPPRPPGRPRGPSAQPGPQPVTQGGLTPEWLTGVQKAEVRTVSAEPVGTGQIGACFRLTLTGAGVPASLVAKLPAADPAARALLGGAYRATTVDWQTLTVGLPARDLSYFLATSLTTEDRRAHEHRLVARYHE